MEEIIQYANFENEKSAFLILAGRFILQEHWRALQAFNRI